MPDKRYRKQAQVKISAEHKEHLVKLAQSTKIDQKSIVEYLLDLTEKYDFFKAGWQERLVEVDRKRNDYTRLDEVECKALRFMDRKWACVWGRDGKPPEIKRLTPDLEDALEVCKACKITLEIKMKQETYQAKIQELETQLKTRATEKFKVPICHYGAILAHDGEHFTGCQIGSRQPVNIKKICQVRRGGEPCSMYAERVLAVGSKL